MSLFVYTFCSGFTVLPYPLTDQPIALSHSDTDLSRANTLIEQDETSQGTKCILLI